MDLVDFAEEPLPRDRGRARRSREQARASATCASSRSRRSTATTSSSAPTRALVRRADAARAPRDGRDRRRPEPRRPPLPGAVGDPPDGGRPPRLPRLRGPGRERAWRAGDEVVVLPSGRRSRVAHVETADGPLDEAVPPMSVVDPPRGRSRRGPRRHARRPGRGPRPRPRARRADLLDERAPARASRQARREAHEPVGARDRGRAPFEGRHGDARARSPRPSGSSSTTSRR